MAVDEGAGIYVEYTSSDFVLAVLNRGCFIQYFTTAIDIPPNQWVGRASELMVLVMSVSCIALTPPPPPPFSECSY